MARSRHIYVVEYAAYGDRWLKAAFTVKHELVAWLGRAEQRPNLDDYVVTRLPDGGYGGNPDVLSIPELLAS